jgi:hypothetical protein
MSIPQDILRSVKALRAHTSLVGKHYVKRAGQVGGTVEGQELVAEAKAALGLIFEASADSLSHSQAMSSRGPNGNKWQAVLSSQGLQLQQEGAPSANTAADNYEDNGNSNSKEKDKDKARLHHPLHARRLTG